ncbi:MAG: hypothetical protein JW797_18800 [Bradymonadales bacterium]|nr:hypothetical protein [Bradymonadales bacterium]
MNRIEKHGVLSSLCLVCLVGFVSCGDAPVGAPGTDLAIDLGPDIPDIVPDELPDQLQDQSLSDQLADVGDMAIDEQEEPDHGEGIILRIYSLDIWAEPLVEPQLSISRRSENLLQSSETVSSIRLPQAGTYLLRLAAPHHHPLELTLVYEGGPAIDSVEIDADGLQDFHGLSVARSQQVIEGVEESVVTLFLGLRHRWFSASGAPGRHGNQVELLTDGEDAWSQVYPSLLAAEDRVHIGVWWWESDFELIRPAETHLFLTDTERRANTIDSILDSSPAVSRVLVWQDNLVSWLTIDAALQQRGSTPNDRFEFMGASNNVSGVFWWEIQPFYFGDRVQATWSEASQATLDPEEPIFSDIPGREVDLTAFPYGLEYEVRIASWHQKFLVIDGQEAFIGGMNMKGMDWDGSDHWVFDYRRMAFDASSRDRLAVSAHEREPDNGPRKDYMLHLVGPAVEDVEEVFFARWMHQIEIGQEYWQNASGYAIRRDLAPVADGIDVQVTTTMPEPFMQYSNLESMRNAILNAERYILVEDQYWRAPLLTEAILTRMAARPDLVLVVVSKPIDEWLDPACEWTYRTDQSIRRFFSNRYFLYQLQSFDTAPASGNDETRGVFVDIDTHSKLLMVDDIFLSIGSCNKNNRGLIYEGEINLAILDEPFVHEARHRILSNMLGYENESDDPWDWVAEMETATQANQVVYENWDKNGFDISLDGQPLPEQFTPQGFLYPLDYGVPADCFIEGIGQDIM